MNIKFKGLTTKGEWIQGSLVETNKNENQILLPYMYQDFLHIKKLGVHNGCKKK